MQATEKWRTAALIATALLRYLVPKADVPANAVNLSTHTQGTIRRKAAT